MLDAFLKYLPLPLNVLSADLQGVNGHTGRGKIQFAKLSNGHSHLKIRLRGVAGKLAEFVPDSGDPIQIKLSEGSARLYMMLPQKKSSQSILGNCAVEIRQNGETIMNGVLSEK